MSMSDYTWYKVFNKTEFEALGLVSKTYFYNFDTLGNKEVLVTKGNLLNVTFDDIFLPINLNSNNPFELDDRAVYLDTNDDVWVGVLNED